jgi:hypothetical protein
MRTSLLMLALLCGCVSAAPSTQGTGSNDRILGVNNQTGEVLHTQATVGPEVASIHASTDVIWNVLPTVYSDLGIELTVIDKPSGTIGNRSFVKTRSLAGRRLSAYFECGSSMTGQRADEGRVNATVVTKISAAADGQTQLSTTVTGEVQTTEGSSAQTIPCASTGALEEQIRTSVARKSGAM